MSRKFQPKNKDLVKLDVLLSKDVWRKTKKKNGQEEYKLRKDIKIYGKVNKGFSSSVTSSNLKGENHKFVQDFSSLPKKTKNQVTDMFMNKNKKVAYLIEK